MLDMCLLITVMLSVLADGLPAVAAGQVPASGGNDPAAQIQQSQVVPIDAFLSERGTTLAAAAGSLRTAMGYPAEPGLEGPDGCDGPVLDAETDEADEAGQFAAIGAHQLSEVVNELLENGPAELAQAVTDLEASGGGLIFDTEGHLEDQMIALRVGKKLIVGDAWVRAALDNPASIHGNIAHEVGGHMRYGVPLSCVLLETALAGTPALHDFDAYRSAYLTYVYPETEIYAELHELAYHSELGIGDDPYVDIIVMAQQIRDAYPADLADLIFGWLRYRCATDSTLTEPARYYCDAALNQVAA